MQTVIGNWNIQSQQHFNDIDMAQISQFKFHFFSFSFLMLIIDDDDDFCLYLIFSFLLIFKNKYIYAMRNIVNVLEIISCIL